MQFFGQVGPQSQSAGDGVSQAIRLGKQGDAAVSELHGRFYEQTYRGFLFSTGMQVTSIANATFTAVTALSATLATAATATPIVGIWNPINNNVNAVVLQAQLAVVITALQSTGCGGFQWCVFPAQASISVGSQAVPVNQKSFLAQGSNVRGLSGLALTGLVAAAGGGTAGNFLRASAHNGGSAINAAELQTAAGFSTIAAPSVENIDGSIVVPPGGVLGLFCSTTPVAHSAVSGLLWEEVPIV